MIYERVVLGNADTESEALDLDIAMIGKSDTEIRKEEQQNQGDVNMTIIVGDASEEVSSKRTSTSLDRPAQDSSSNGDNKVETPPNPKASKPTNRGQPVSRGNSNASQNNEKAGNVEMQEKKQRKKSPARRSENKAAAAEAKFLI